MSNSENKSKREEKKPLDDDEFEEMEVDEEVDDEPETGGEVIDSTTAPAHGGHGRRRRIKIRKRIRVKKKTSSKRKYKKIAERIIWIIFIVGFILSLYYLLNGLGISDQKYKSTPKSRGMLFPRDSNNPPGICFCENKQNLQIGVRVI